MESAVLKEAPNRHTPTWRTQDVLRERFVTSWTGVKTIKSQKHGYFRRFLAVFAKKNYF
jgi:hypothetical protein